MIPLPEPFTSLPEVVRRADHHYRGEGLADAVRAYAAAARRQALEEAARAVDWNADACKPGALRDVLRSNAAAIRALIQAEKG